MCRVWSCRGLNYLRVHTRRCLKARTRSAVSTQQSDFVIIISELKYFRQQNDLLFRKALSEVTLAGIADNKSASKACSSAPAVKRLSQSPCSVETTEILKQSATASEACLVRVPFNSFQGLVRESCGTLISEISGLPSFSPTCFLKVLGVRRLCKVLG